jgi:hypothetical protein
MDSEERFTHPPEGTAVTDVQTSSTTPTTEEEQVTTQRTEIDVTTGRPIGSRFEVGDRVRAEDHPTEFGPYEGTVVEVKKNEDGDVRYVVREVDWKETEYATFAATDLELDPSPSKLDTDDLGALRRELVDSAAKNPVTDHHTGIFARDRAERIRSAARIAWLANRICWLEACEQGDVEGRCQGCRRHFGSDRPRVAGDVGTGGWFCGECAPAVS